MMTTKINVTTLVAWFLFCGCCFYFSGNVIASGTNLCDPVVQNATWSYTQVRTGANMFWLLYYARPPGWDPSNHKVNYYLDYPLVIWLQGGPGGSSVGFGNFLELGPCYPNKTARPYAWTTAANVMFVDNPVGVGFSYVDSLDLLVRNNSAIADDFVVMLNDFFGQLPEFATVPTYIFSESYGGKMTVGIARKLSEVIAAGGLKMNLKGVALGDSWISPIDSVATWADYLLTTSLIDYQDKVEIDKHVDEIRKELAAGRGADATQSWSVLEDLVETVTDGVNWYNILIGPVPQEPVGTSADSKASAQLRSFRRHVTNPIRYVQNGGGEPDIDKFMNEDVRAALGVIPKNVTWGGQADAVFTSLSGDFMWPVVEDVDYLLNETSLSVAIYTGQLDLIVDTVGTLNWIMSLKWPKLEQFLISPRFPFTGDDKMVSMYEKRFDRLGLYWVLQAGHMVPYDQSETSLRLLNLIINDKC